MVFDCERGASLMRVEVEKTPLSCDGGGGALGHPRVFLHMKKGEKQIDCPYCSCRFVLKDNKQA